MELLLVRDLVVIGLIVTLGLLSLVVLRLTRPWAHSGRVTWCAQSSGPTCASRQVPDDLYWR